ncbi:Ig-like domain-containing protein [Bacillus salipaludis]|uniref:Ig-like domain-containing protein n=1 Tax=Bacillus salipaludis TaxID=2547811 RepID=A0ABW8RNV2_9BACI
MKRIIFALVLLFGFSASSFLPNVEAETEGGTVVSPDPADMYIEIRTAEDLNKIRNGLDGKYILKNNIDLSEATSEGGAFYNNGAGWEPIGTQRAPFTGELDGNGFDISGLKITDRTGSVGFFGYTDGAVIKNIGIVDSTIHVNTTSSGSNYGGFAGQAIHTTFEQVYSGVDINLYLANEYSAKVGGLAGYLSQSSIQDSFSYGNISVKAPFRSSFGTVTYPWIAAGTLAGYASDGNITNSYSVGKLSEMGEEHPDGGSLAEGPVVITNSYYLGEKTYDEMLKQSTYEGFDFASTWKMGNGSGYPFPVFAADDVPVTNNTAEFAGGMGTSFSPYKISNVVQLNHVRDHRNAYYVLTNDVSLGSLDWKPIGTDKQPFSGVLDGNGFRITDMNLQFVSDGSITAAGLFAFMESSKVHDLGVVNGQINVTRGKSLYSFYAGGLAARVTDSEIVNVWTDNNLSISSYYNNYTGGIAGTLTNSTIVNSYNLGSIYANSSDNYAFGGGIAATAAGSSIKKVYNGGSVHVSSTFYGGAAGGLAGQLSSTQLEDSFNIGNTSSGSWSTVQTGGIVGQALEHSLVHNTYNIGQVEGMQFDTNIGGGITGNVTDSEVSNSYYFNKNNKLPVNGKTKDEMLSASTYAGFDFGGTWKMGAGSEFGFPVLAGVRFAIPETAENISFKSLPTKLTYQEGEDLDVTGAVLAVPTNFLNERDVVVTPDMVGHVYMNQPGTQSVSVNYGNWSIDFNITIIEKDRTPPDKPIVNEITDLTTVVTGTSEPGATVSVQVGNTILGETVVGKDGRFSIPITSQQAGTVVFISARDTEGNLSVSNIVTVKEVPKIGWIDRDNHRYYYYEQQGKMAVGWKSIGGAWYYFDYDGKMVTGWFWDFNAHVWYYLKSDGKMATGWLSDGGTWYYFAGSGAMKTGWMQSGSTWYYFKNSGAMATGWMQSGSTWYYFAGSGAMKTGWLQSGSTWYYFASSGAMKTGWVQDGGTWYYFNGSGAMATGWLLSGSTWYYFQSGGAMQTGWAQISGKWYYFDQNGALK